jgi:putative DNA methylase
LKDLFAENAKLNDRRLIEDYLPIQAISAEASREKSVRKGHISTLHLWWARRPLVACRAAVYGALVPASRFIPENGPDNKKQSLGRANAAKFVERLCKYPGNPTVIKEAQKHILEAHAERLTRETGKKVTVEDIEEGRSPRPKVLDMFAGGGAIPLEALRLGCETYALDLNPVAHIIELCTLVYPQKYGKPDPNARGMTGPKNDKGETTWGVIADEVNYWGEWVLKKVKSEIDDLYPLVPDRDAEKNIGYVQPMFQEPGREEIPPGYLVPVVYLWTRTVRCKNPNCGATVPLSKLQWIRRERGNKPGRYIALMRKLDETSKRVLFWPLEARTRNEAKPPDITVKAGNVACPFCGTANDDQYVKNEGCSDRMPFQLMAIGARGPGSRSKRKYIDSPSCEQGLMPDADYLQSRIDKIIKSTGITPPDEPVVRDGKRSVWVDLYGLKDFGLVFTTRQLIVGLSAASAIQKCHKEICNLSGESGHASAVCAYLGMALDRHMNQNNSLTIFNAQGETVEGAVNDKTLPMAWDFAEPNPFSGMTGSLQNALSWVVSVANAVKETASGGSAHVLRGSATVTRFNAEMFDAVVTDPPYYDNVSYSVLSDFFYGWLKRSIGSIFPEHFASVGAPKKNEAVMDAVRHNGNKDNARAAYESLMEEAFRQACVALKPNGTFACVYAHKTTLGWSTLVDALRRSGFCITEAWPVETERKGGRKGGKAMLASSIFLVARKREKTETGSYEDEVRSELDHIVRERVDTLWKMGITGADLVIAAVGAGLRAFTRFARVEYANGEEVPAERFLAEVEGVVLETLLEKIFGVVGSGVAAVDGPSRFYVLWRYTYKAAEMDAGEAIVFTYGQHVELDGQNGLSTGRRALVEKKKGKYRLRDFAERGDDEKLGMPKEDLPAAAGAAQAGGTSAPLIDALHRILWLVENQPRNLNRFLDEARPERERLRLWWPKPWRERRLPAERMTDPSTLWRPLRRNPPRSRNSSPTGGLSLRKGCPIST